MRCLLCGKPTRILSERQNGVMLLRVRQCTAKVAHAEDVVTTHELPAAVIGWMGASRLKTRIQVMQRGMLARARAQVHRSAVAAGIAARKTSKAIAREQGITEARVRQIAKDLRR